jgi:hypothetical protein
MATKKQPASRWHDGTTPVEDLPETEQIAHELVIERRDLAPSVERIMDAEISDDQRNQAMTMFRDSLTQDGDPNRDPRVAIATATAAG